MSEIRTTEVRSALMRRVRREDTGLEQFVGEVLWSTGARYRRNVRDLPGTPDFANKTRAKAVFVHGCFWHFHAACSRGRLPTRNRSFWARKFAQNRNRDKKKERTLKNLGYDVLVVWECELLDRDELRNRLKTFWFSDDAGNDEW